MTKLLQTDIDMFAGFGIPEEVIREAQVQRVTDEQARMEFYIRGDGDMSGLVFPYHIPGVNGRVTCRVCRDHPEIDKNGKLDKKYVAPYGDTRHVYFAPRAEELLLDKETEIVFVEAEKSVLAIEAYRRRVGKKILAIATGGAYGWKGKHVEKVITANGEREDRGGPLPDLYVANSRKCTILFDANVATRPDLKEARLKLIAALRGEQAATILTVDLPQRENVNGPDDFLGQCGDEELTKLLAQAQAPTKRMNEEMLKEQIRDTFAKNGAKQQALEIIDALLASENATVDSDGILQDAALLTTVEYESRRERLAKRLHFRVSTLDQEVAKRRKESGDDKVGASKMTVEDLQGMVEELLDVKPMEADKKEAECIIWEYIATHAKVFCCGGQGVLLMNDGDGVPIEVSPDGQDFNKLLISFGIHPGSPNRQRVGEYIETQCYHRGVQTETRLSFHFDPGTFTAYVAWQRGKVIKVTRHGLFDVANGTDNVLFVFPQNWHPLLTKSLEQATIPEFPKLDRVKRALFADGFLVKHLFEGTSFEIRTLDEKQIRILVLAYILFLMMPGVVSERAMFQTLGPSGSGKTFLLELIGFILSGPKFSARPLPTDLREFENQIINEFFVCYDNVSRVPAEIKDRFCQAVTGCEVVRRVLFTTKREMRERSKATIALSAINPPLPELEHGNRTITACFEERPENSTIAKEELFREVAKNRDEIIIGLLYRMGLALEALEAQRDYIPKVNVRLASVATFILRIARHEGWEKRANELLIAWGAEQTGYSMSDDDVCIALTRWIGDPALFEPGKELSAAMLNAKLLRAMHAENSKDDLTWGGSHIRLGKVIGANLKVYASKFGLQRQNSTLRNTRGGHTYKFNPSQELLKEIQEAAKYERENS